MKRLVFAAAFVLGYLSPLPSPAHCVYCTTTPCLASDYCGEYCSCVKKGADMWGTCMSLGD